MALSNQIETTLLAKDNSELHSIWEQNDRTTWSDQAMATVGKILKDRGEELKPQRAAIDPYVQADAPKQRITFDRLWNGNLDLATTYWGFGVLGGITIQLAFYVLGVLGTEEILPPIFLFLLGTVIGLVGLIYTVIVLVAIWRSAGNYQGPRALAVISRIVVFLNGIFLLLSVARVIEALT